MDIKRIIVLFTACLCLIGVAAAYYVNISVPSSVILGDVIQLTGESNLPAGHSTTVTFSVGGAYPRVIAQKIVTIQSGGKFSTTFETKGLEAGRYKVEIQESGSYTYGSGSRTWRFIDVIDRSGELRLTSPMQQEFDGSLEIAGTIEAVKDEGIELSVQRGVVSVFGPEFIPTRAGAFSSSVEIDESGTYQIQLKDRSGYRWSFEVEVPAPATPTPTPEVTFTPLPTTPPPTTATPTPVPTTQSTPLPVALVLIALLFLFAKKR